jgi:hypothetical protein
LKSISGTYGSYEGQLVITSLSFITNLTTYGPFGTAPGETFSIPIADSAVVGFHGRCASYLDALGIFVTPVSSFNYILSVNMVIIDACFLFKHASSSESQSFTSLWMNIYRWIL